MAGQFQDKAVISGLMNAQIFMKEVPLKRIADPIEIADAALWLSASPSITGTTVTIDGGNGLRRAPQPEEFLPQAT